MTIEPPFAGTGAERLRLRLHGAVQGVGMRPFIHRLATEYALGGFVRNGADGVLIEVEGARVDDFVSRLATEWPPLAQIDRFEVEPMAPAGDGGFVIEASTGGRVATRIVADAATCAECRADLFDPSSRFFQYPFVNCTHCGPRFTITHALPYDRSRTAMAPFALCEACERDYADPANRRFHAEPIACPACGPRLSHDVATIASVLAEGGIVALKGIGGFHLMCDARDETAVMVLRRRKRRDAKPFAVMVAGPAALPGLVRARAPEIALAGTVAAPIVLMEAEPGALAPGIAPGLGRVGILFAYAPVHHLVFAALAALRPEAPAPALVATSANPAGDPLIISDAEAERRLAAIADLVVTHDRAIMARADDSVMHVIAGAPAFLRRARGAVPEPIPLDEDGPTVLALGGHHKSTVALVRGREAFVSQHIGDLDSAETVRFWRETIDHLLKSLACRPDVIACDLHPDYRSSQMAGDFGRPVIRVQHQAAHVAAVAAEHGQGETVLGLALDGHGLGDDGTAWGGEMIVIEGAGWRRLGHLEALPLPSGDRAAREPWRMGVAALHRLGQGEQASDRFRDLPVAGRLAGPLAARLASGVEAQVTTSLGRLFDAAVALIGTRLSQAYEGQAAMELEALVREPKIMPGGWTLENGVLSFAPLLGELANRSLDPRTGAELFHGTLIEGLTALAAAGAAQTGLADICLGGGCMMNRILAEGLSSRFAARGLTARLARRLPPNDGGLSLGQAVLARRLATR